MVVSKIVLSKLQNSKIFEMNHICDWWVLPIKIKRHGLWRSVESTKVKVFTCRQKALSLSLERTYFSSIPGQSESGTQFSCGNRIEMTLLTLYLYSTFRIPSDFDVTDDPRRGGDRGTQQRAGGAFSGWGAGEDAGREISHEDASFWSRVLFSYETVTSTRSRRKLRRLRRRRDPNPGHEKCLQLTYPPPPPSPPPLLTGGSRKARASNSDLTSSIDFWQASSHAAALTCYMYEH